MTSLLTNTAAMTALTTLKSISSQLDTTSNRVSTGLRVSTAADNAAYWSIATTIRTDNNSLGAVKDALGLGSSAVDTAYTGVNNVITSLQNLRSKLQTATSSSVDRSKVQEEITATLAQIKAYADSSVSSGQNWLSVDSSDTAGYKDTQSVVAGFTRDKTGAITFSNVDIDVKSIRLYDKAASVTPETAAKIVAGKAVNGTVDLSGSNDASLTIQIGSNASETIKLDAIAMAGVAADAEKVTKDELLSAINKSIANNTNLKGLVTASLDEAGRLSLQTTATGATAALSVTGNASVDVGFGSAAVTASGTAGTTGTAGAGGILDTGATRITDINISSATDAQVATYITAVDKAIAAVTTAGSKLGAKKTQIDTQITFVDALKKANERTIGTLVDADIEEESTKLKALQTQQQLAVQALSIANSSSQNVLSLFR
ncbi:flagellin N-terminal helical domain-containing protein [Methylobacterium sp. ID0610]|uniref:flagellin N-terminal helical domain-containing protein n=1 Tax=Methylobacterium carpenticola TaxID=3344827 RepID=UPI0036BF2764